MKTAISLPDELFDDAERLAKRLGVSRSELYQRAVAEYVARNSPDAVTEGWTATVAAVGENTEAGFAREAARRALERSEW